MDKFESTDIKIVSDNTRTASEEVAVRIGSTLNRRSSSDSPTESSLLLHNKMKLKLSSIRNAVSNRSLLVDFLAILFGVASWIGINSTYVQLPILVQKAPEGWSLPSYIVFIIQIANIGPITYTLLQKYRSIKDAYMIYLLLVIGVVATLFMSFYYQETAYIFGAERSVAILIIVFFFALIGCTSSVLFMPYMGRFRDIYLIMYLIGEGLTGFLPAIIALVQGVGGNAECIPNNSTELDAPEFISHTADPAFNTKVYYLIVFGIVLASFIAFILLDMLPSIKQEYAAVTIVHGNNYVYTTDKIQEEHSQQTEKLPVADTDKPEFKQLSQKNFKLLLILLGVVCVFSNAILPSIQSYSNLPYGNVAYHLAVTLSSMANPVACFLAVFLPHTGIRSIVGLSIISVPVASYAIATAMLSPAPPLVGTMIGDVLVIVTWTVLIGLTSYIRLSITTVFRYQGGKSLVIVGAVTQLGSFLGAIVSFTAVNYSGFFQAYYPCS